MIIKTNSKETEQKFIENLKNLFESPEQLLPECMDSCFMCPIKSYAKKIDKMKSSGDYSKYSNSADQFLSAVSESYKILDNEKAPVFGMIKTNYGSVNYCKRGKTDEMILSGVQNYDNETYKMLAFTNVVKSKKLKIYSSKNYFKATCKENIDINFVKDLLNEENITYKYEGNVITLGSAGNSILIEFYGITVKVMEDLNENIIYIMLRHMMFPDMPFNLSTDFMEFIPDNKSILNDYIIRKTSSRNIIARIKKDKINYAIKNGYYIINSVNYSIDDFLEELHFDNILRPFLKEKLAGTGFVLDSPGQRKVLEYLFPKYKNEIIKLMYNLDDAEIKSLKGNPLEVIENARVLVNKNSMKAKIMEPWSENSKYLIELLTFHLNSGRDEAINFGRKSMKNDIQKSIYYAYLQVENHSDNWLFNENQIKLGALLVPYIDKMLKTGDINKELENLRGIIQ